MSRGPVRVMLSELTGRAWVVSKYQMTGGRLVAEVKHDVTADVVHHLMAQAWARGWNECNAAPEGATPPNPYRPTTEDDGDGEMEVPC